MRKNADLFLKIAVYYHLEITSRSILCFYLEMWISGNDFFSVIFIRKFIFIHVMALKIGVFGSAIGKHSNKERTLAFLLGEEIAKNNCVLVTGATFGLPNEAIKGTRNNNGISIGISPANSVNEHKNKYKLPMDDDHIIFTGLGYEGRNLVNIKTSDICLFIKGSIGTLNELTIAIKNEKVIGILTNSGGVSAVVKKLLSQIKINFKPKIIYSNDPIDLIKKTVLVHKRINK